MRLTPSELEKLAAAYDYGLDLGASPLLQQWAREQASRVHSEFAKLQKRVDVIFTERDPYRSFEELDADVRDHKRMFVYTGGSDTPLWDERTNWMARAVHDWDHVEGRFDFSVEGELGAYKYSAARAPGLAKLYLSEIALQAASSALSGFADGPQKVVLASPAIQRLADQFSANGSRKRVHGATARDRKRALDAEALALRLRHFMKPEDLAVHLGAAGLEAPLGLTAAASTVQFRPEK